MSAHGRGGPGETDDLGSGNGERYERLEHLATGGMGEVWRARDTLLGREVAVKVLKAEYADDPTFRERFAAEARHAAGLHHPGIAAVFDYGILDEGHQPYLVMELVEGKPLSALLGGGRALDPEQARGLVVQAAEALGEAHHQGVVHRDVKPANLLVTPEGQVKITDFGIARAADSAAITQTGEIIGTPHYLSPEQANGQAATAASDVYALGVLLFECLTGARPFVADTPVGVALAHLRQEVPPLPSSVPADLAAVTRRALVKDPARRYSDGTELAAALRGDLDQTQAIVPPLGASATPPGQPPVATPVTGPVAAPLPGSRPATSPVAERLPSGVTRAPGRRRLSLYTVGALAALLVVGLLVTHPWSNAGEGTASPTHSASPVAQAARTVRVTRAAYVGKPVEEVRAELRGLGLRTRVEDRANDGTHEQGTVADVDPTGRVKAGTRIALGVWAAPTPEPADGSSGATGRDAQKGTDKAPDQAGSNQGKSSKTPSKGTPGKGNQKNPGNAGGGKG